MGILIFFLKAWSIAWSIILMGWIWVIKNVKPQELKFQLDLKTCFEWTIYATSIYSWFYIL